MTLNSEYTYCKIFSYILYLVQDVQRYCSAIDLFRFGTNIIIIYAMMILRVIINKHAHCTNYMLYVNVIHNIIILYYKHFKILIILIYKLYTE